MYIEWSIKLLCLYHIFYNYFCILELKKIRFIAIGDNIHSCVVAFPKIKGLECFDIAIISKALKILL